MSVVLEFLRSLVWLVKSVAQALVPSLALRKIIVKSELSDRENVVDFAENGLFVLGLLAFYFLCYCLVVVVVVDYVVMLGRYSLFYLKR